MHNAPFNGSVSSNARWRPSGFMERIGAALVAPRSALAEADELYAAGRASSDLAALVGLAFLSTYTPEIVEAVWVAVAESVTSGFQRLLAQLSGAIAVDLAALFASAFALTLAAGTRRALGRDFDLACVVVVPLVCVRLVAEFAVKVSGFRLPHSWQLALGVIACAWVGAMLVLAWQTARRRQPRRDNPAKEPAQTHAPTTSQRARQHRHTRLAGLAIAGVLASTLGVQAAWVARHLDGMRPVSPGTVAPLFALPAVDDQGRISDEFVALSDLRGKVVIVEFWATWCTPCKHSLPAVERVYRRYRDRGVQVISINTDDPAKARWLMNRNQYTMPLYVDDGRVATAYKVNSIPHLVVIDQRGLVRHVPRGFKGEDTLNRQVARLLH